MKTCTCCGKEHENKNGNMYCDKCSKYFKHIGVKSYLSNTGELKEKNANTL